MRIHCYSPTNEGVMARALSPRRRGGTAIHVICPLLAPPVPNPNPTTPAPAHPTPSNPPTPTPTAEQYGLERHSKIENCSGFSSLPPTPTPRPPAQSRGGIPYCSSAQPGQPLPCRPAAIGMGRALEWEWVGGREPPSSGTSRHPVLIGVNFLRIAAFFRKGS